MTYISDLISDQLARSCLFSTTSGDDFYRKLQRFSPKTFTKAYNTIIISDLLSKGQICPTFSGMLLAAFGTLDHINNYLLNGPDRPYCW